MTVSRLPITDIGSGMPGHYVYVLLCHDDGPIFAKIGHTSSPVNRLNQLKVGTPVTPRWMFYVRVWSETAARKLEARLHSALSMFRTNGEWFEFEEQDRELVNKVMATEFQPFKCLGYDMKWSKMPADPAKHKKLAEEAITVMRASWHTMEERCRDKAARRIAKIALKGLTL